MLVLNYITCINFIDEKNINTGTSLIESDKIGVNIYSIFKNSNMNTFTKLFQGPFSPSPPPPKTNGAPVPPSYFRTTLFKKDYERRQQQKKDTTKEQSFLTVDK